MKLLFDHVDWGQRVAVVHLHGRPINQTSGQCYDASTLVNYNSRVVSISNLLVITILEL